MATGNLIERMKPLWPSPSLSFSTLLAALVCSGGLALAQGNDAAPAASGSASAGQGGPTNSPPPAVLSPAVGDILKLADAGVSQDVIRTYVECSATPCQPTGADLIALKQHKVGDDIATLLLKRAAQARVAVAQARAQAIQQVISARNASSGGLDPEGYDYFRFNYLQPRAMAFAYQQLSPYYYPSYGYPYRYGPAFGSPYFRRGMY
jgi:hypothetical protein